MSNGRRHSSIWIALGGALGALARHGLESSMSLPPHAAVFPWATLGINLSGAFSLGWIIALDEVERGKRVWLRSFAGVGFCGAFTTFSSVNLQMVEMAQTGEVALAVFYFATTFLLGIGVAWAGAFVGMQKIGSRLL